MSASYSSIVAGLRALALVSSMALAVSCSQAPVLEWPAQAPSRQTWHTEEESRKVWHFDSGKVTLVLGAVPETGRLRLGVKRDTKAEGDLTDTSAVRAAVYVSNRRAHTIETDGKGNWADASIELDGYSSGAECRVVFSSASPFWVGPLDLFSARPDPDPNVLIVMIDTLRLDHTSWGGYDRDTTPVMTDFAGEAAAFTQLIPPSSWTRPSIASLLTGVRPPRHGVRDTPEKLRPKLPSLAETLEGAGYATIGVVGNGNVTPRWGMGLDFELFDGREGNTDDDRLFRLAKTELDRVRGRPWFLYLHVFGPHYPYEVPGAAYHAFQDPGKALRKAEIVAWLRKYDQHTVGTYQENIGFTQAEAEKNTAPVPEWLPPFSPEFFAKLCIDLYDAHIRYTDSLLGDFFAYLKRTGVYENTLIVLLSDHGEEFYEHGKFQHRQSLYEEQLRLPLFIRTAGGRLEPKRVDRIVEIHDVAPTILDLLGIPAPKGMQGRGFRGLLAGGNGGRDMGYSRLINKLEDYRFETAKTPRFKYLVNRSTGEEWWFDLKKDPGEQHPLAAAPAEAAELKPFLEARRASSQAPGLYLSLTGDFESEYIFEGSIRGPKLEKADVVERGARIDLKSRDNEIRFRAVTEKNGEREAYMYPARAVLRFDVPPKQPVTLSLDLNGRPMPDGITLFEDGAGRIEGETLTVTPKDVKVAPGSVEPILFERATGAYLWYVGETKQATVSDLDEESVEQLKSLGYLE